ncbi:hypothetical protein E2C01_082243 [Portunus trituberculatus]|uniref:Uncharacterized protein n=1 Tax=Portunus trituberculatus TaxID=210409 RepID=A0A5B7IU09_PORTR|nr:hypothetical protein [Portunus trituberculatus]
MLTLIHSSGTFSSFIELVIISQIGSSSCSLHSFSNQPDTPSKLSNDLPISSLCTVISCNPWQCNVLLRSVKSSTVNTFLKLSFIISNISFSVCYVFPPLIIFFCCFFVLYFTIYEFIEKFGFVFVFIHHIFHKVSFFLSPYSNILISHILIMPSVIVISLLYEFLPSFIFCLFCVCTSSIVPSVNLFS